MSTLITHLQDAIDQGWLMDTRSCLRGKPRMKALLCTALEIARGVEYLHAQVEGGGGVLQV